MNNSVLRLDFRKFIPGCAGAEIPDTRFRFHATHTTICCTPSLGVTKESAMRIISHVTLDPVQKRSDRKAGENPI